MTTDLDLDGERWTRVYVPRAEAARASLGLGGSVTAPEFQGAVVSLLVDILHLAPRASASPVDLVALAKEAIRIHAAEATRPAGGAGRARRARNPAEPE